MVDLNVRFATSVVTMLRRRSFMLTFASIKWPKRPKSGLKNNFIGSDTISWPL